MEESRPPQPNAKQDTFGGLTEECDHGEVLHSIPTPIYTMACGVLAVVLASVAFMASFSMIAYIDLPVNFVLFLVSGSICLGAGEKRSEAVPGVIVTAVGVVISCTHLVFVLDHPWYH